MNQTPFLSRNGLRHVRQALILLSVALVVAFPNSAGAQVVDPIVQNNNDAGGGSLRQAIADATDGSTITFDIDVSGQTIRLLTGQLAINKNLIIDGSSLPDPITISGDKDNNGMGNAGDSRVFDISAGGHNVSLRTLIIAGGYQSSGSGGGIKSNSANLIIQNSTITGNSASSGTNAYAGGGIFQNGGTVTIVSSTISNNTAGSSTRSTSSNTSGGGGGGIFSTSGTLNVQNSTITGNSAGSATNSSDGNATGGHGGGIYAANGSVRIDSSTIVNNYAGDASSSTGTETGGEGGGIDTLGTVDITLGNSIIAENFVGTGGTADGSGPDINKDTAMISRIGKNLIGNNHTIDTAFPDPPAYGEPNSNGDLVGTPGLPLFPQLQPLADNGGPTLTLMPYFDSVVVNAGSAADRPQDSTDINWNLDLTELLPTDQAGAPRVSGGELDLGAFEYQFPAPAQPTMMSESLEKTVLRIKISKTSKKLKKAKKSGKKAKAKKLNSKLKKLKKKLASL